MKSRIKTLRESTGLSQSAFAKKIDVPVRSLQQWEQGRSNPPSYVIKLIERMLLAEKEHAIAFSPQDYFIPPKKSWKVCIEQPFQNCEHIYPIQQRKVQALLDALEEKNDIERIIIFGSSVTDRCHMGSDVDIFVGTNDTDNPFKDDSADFDFEYDVWTNSTVDARLLQEIETKGVLVYG